MSPRMMLFSFLHFFLIIFFLNPTCSARPSLARSALSYRQLVKFPLTSRAGLSGESCSKNDDCNEDRACVTIGLLDFTLCTSGGGLSCMCVPALLGDCGFGEQGDDGRCLVSCSSSECNTGAECTLGFGTCLFSCTGNDDCPNDEVCTRGDVLRNSESERGTCISREIVENDDDLELLKEEEEGDDGVCIDASALTHLEAKDLVYEVHAVGRVLCDTQGSCATPGHIVKYSGKAMMMKSYCGLVGCKSRVIRVNSPRYKVGMRVPSKTEGLEYTALAARYESLAEETALSTIVRIGF